MVKVVVKKLSANKRAHRGRAVSKTRVRDSSGKLVQVFTIDADSPTFDDDLTYAYKANVARARRENKKMFGSPDGFEKLAHRMKSSGSFDAVRKK